MAAVAVVAAGTVITSAASTSPSLPPRTPAQLLRDIAATKSWPQALSGTITTSAALGLPSLPGLDGPDGPPGSSPLSPSWLLTGTHTYQVWYGGPGRLRIAAPVQLGETDLRADGSSLWLWDSWANTATHYVRPAGDGAPALPTAPPGHSKTSVASTTVLSYSSALTFSPDPAGPPSPQQFARQFLAAVGPTTTVSVADNVTVAGRAAYQLVLAPKSSQSLVGRLTIAVDAATHLPLQVQVIARGAASPAFSEGFTALSLAPPAASNFTFTPPPGAKVRTVRLPGRHGLSGGPFSGPPQMAGPGSSGRPGSLHPRGLPGLHHVMLCKPQGPQIHLEPKGCLTPAQFRKLTHGGRGAPAFGLARPGRQGSCQAGWSAYTPSTGLTDPAPCTQRTFGTSWTTVMAFPAETSSQATAGPLGMLLRAARPVSGAWGSGRLLTTSLLSVLITGNGTVLAGAVTPGTLFADAAQLKAP
jgi:outer membrane lipoprotein-sorting protein